MTKHHRNKSGPTDQPNSSNNQNIAISDDAVSQVKEKQLIDKTAQILKLMDQLSDIDQHKKRITENSLKNEHKFWSTQPVPQTLEEVINAQEEGPLRPDTLLENLPTEPSPLPNGFCWVTINVQEEKEMQELYVLLNQNYVEDLESMFRFDYPANFLHWALCPPGWKQAWNVGIRVQSSSKLVAFISAIPCTIRTSNGSMLKTVEVNFLCIHKKIRAKRLAPVLIREITRRANLSSIFQALYTAGTVLPEPITKARYWHRPLNFRKLCETGFATIPYGKTLQQMEKHNYLSRDHCTPGFRPMTEADVSAVTNLLNGYLTKFSVTKLFDHDQIKHWFLPRPNVLYSYVIEEGSEGISDFVSFYSLPSTVMDNMYHSSIQVAYLFYYATQSPDRLDALIHAALVMAKGLGFDVFNCVEIMDNSTFLKSQMFSEGDGYLHYYFYNWKSPHIPPNKMAIVML